ncbi:tagaturonate reductase [Paenibacillus macerans]|uniref:tagaturonate reductase n=1 Tax=Paenibacillus macerans TaxID=44252 RepID=UPI002E22DB27|nr:tagaturonate reductase [Paenibacillus macerans]
MNRLTQAMAPGRAVRPAKVLQFGEGNFLRAFVDWQIDIMNKKTGFNGNVVIVQPLPAGLAEALNEQDGLYTVYLEGMKEGRPVREHSLIESVARGINPYSEYEAYAKLAENPDLRFIISNTTEAGIAFAPADRLEDQPQSSYPGKLTALLHRRYQYFGGDRSKGFIIIPCELIDRNGDELKAIVLKYAELWNLGADFVNWLHEANTFCCSLVDRIVPGYPKERIGEITEELGYEDRFVVVGEQFHLWVIEGPQWIKEEFPAELAGLQVLVVDDMTPYRTRKVRILNGAHTALTPVAYLYGLDTVGESVDHPVVEKFVESLIYDEIIPTLELPKEELQSFAAAVLERFRNPFVRHYLMSIALNSVSKFKTRDLPTLLTYSKEQGKLPRKLTFAFAALLAFYKGKRGGEPIELADDRDVLDQFAALWRVCDGSREAVRRLVAEVLASKERWGMDLNEVNGLAGQLAEDLYHIESAGMVRALEDLLGASAGAEQ